MLKNFLKKFFVIALELILISGALWYVADKKGIKSVSEIGPRLERLASQVNSSVDEPQQQPFPVLTESAVKKFNWEHANVKYSLDETLYKSVYEYYQNQPKTFSYEGQLPQDWEDQYYKMFLNLNESDKSIETLASDLQNLGKKHNLSDDQIVDLVLAFVQAIEYDDAKARDILARADGVSMLHPYELLFEQKGVCSDKSLLAISILKQMGYGTAIFAYEQDNHMAIGIQCPKEYSTYGSGYCYAETTAVGNKIGIIPDFDSSSNKAVVGRELVSAELGSGQQDSLKQLGQVTIYQKTSGKQYSGIIATQKIAKEIDELRKKIDQMKLQLISQKEIVQENEDTLKKMKNELDRLEKKERIEEYNALAKKYNNFLEKYKNSVEKYNLAVTLYNKTIARYNELIKQ